MNKTSWNTATLICSLIARGCFHGTMAEFSSYDRYHMARNAENIHSLAFYRESLSTVVYTIHFSRH